MSTLKVNTIQSNTTSELDINSPLGTIPSLDVIGSATIGGNLNAVGVITATSIVATTGTFSGNVSIGGTLTYEDVTNIDSVGIITARSGVRVNSGGLVVTSGVSTFTNLVVSAGSTSAPSISPTGDSNTGIFFPSPDTVAIAEGGVEALRIDSNGNLGIGTNNPTNELEVLGTGTVASFRGRGGSSFIGIRDEDDGTVAFIGVDGGSLKFQTSGSSYSDKLNIDASGNIGINSTSPARKLDVVDSGASGSVIRSRVTTNNGGFLAYEALNSSGTSVFSVTHNGRINLSENIVFASGQGLDFSATANSSGTMTSELLSDYEEGTWTPVWQSTGTLPTLSYSTQSGHYRKIGNVVHFWGRIYMNSWGGGGGSGNIRVGGLPFTSFNGGGNQHKPLCQVTFTYSGGNAVWPSGATQVFAEVIQDSTSLQYICLGAPTSALGDSAPLQWTSNPQMYNNYFSGTYFTS